MKLLFPALLILFMAVSGGCKEEAAITAAPAPFNTVQMPEGAFLATIDGVKGWYVADRTAPNNAPYRIVYTCDVPFCKPPFVCTYPTAGHCFEDGSGCVDPPDQNWTSRYADPTDTNDAADGDGTVVKSRHIGDPDTIEGPANGDPTSDD